MVYILLFSTVITIILTAIQLYLDYQRDIAVIHDRLAHVELSNIESLREGLWTVNDSAVHLQLEGILKLPDIARVEIIDSNGDSFMSLHDNEPLTSELIITRYPLLKKYRNQKTNLGTLVITSTLSNVYERLWNTLIIILVTQGVKTFLVSIFILLIVFKLIIRYIIKISDHAQALSLHNIYQPLDLNKNPQNFFQNNEIEQLAGTINVMQKEISDHFTEIKLNEAILYNAQNIAGMASWYMNLDEQQTYFSETILDLLMIKPGEEMTLERLKQHIPGKDRKSVLNQINKSIDERCSFTIKHNLIREDDSTIIVEHQSRLFINPSDNHCYLIGTINDITANEYYQKELEWSANYDMLTHLPNRNMFHKWINLALDENKPFYLAIMDLDGFKEVNDAMGHQAGDQLLKMIKPRLEKVLGPDDMIARLGGDEFAFLIPYIDQDEVNNKLLNNIRDAIKQPFNLESIQVQISGSLGVSKFPQDSNNTSTLLRFADVAMYQAKREGLGYCFYESSFDMYSTRRLSLISDLSTSLHKNQFFLMYQPKICLKTRFPESVEALIRWQHPEFGLISPFEFIPLLEMSDLIHPVTNWVVRTALTETSVLQEQYDTFKVAVNVSTRNLQNNKFPEEVANILKNTGCKANVLQLELTESSIMVDPDRAKNIIRQIHDMGVSIAIDDFGTGYSSLAYLKNLAVDELKIDQSFVRNMEHNDSDKVIVKSTIDLAHNLELDVVAEGIENQAVLEQLSKMHCDKGQGYHISKPIKIDDLIQWCTSRNSFS